MWVFLALVAIAAVVYAYNKKQKDAELKRQLAKPATYYDDFSPGVPPPAPEPAKAEPEDTFFDSGERRSTQRRAHLVYTDRNQAQTERTVRIEAFDPTGNVFYGHCELRNARRTFFFNRIRQASDPDTGEIIPNLQAALNADWLNSPEPVLDQLYRQHSHSLRLLLYMAKADGAMRAAEIDVITQHCRQVMQDDRINAHMVKDLLACFDIPPAHTFERIYKQLIRQNPDEARRTAQVCRAIVATQKSIHPLEQTALDILDATP